MKIAITNIGPVKKADIELAPLTVFIGPNNAGKSLTASILYALLTRSEFFTPRTIVRTVQLDLGPDVADAAYEEVNDFLDKLSGRHSPEAIPDQVQRYLTHSLNAALEERMAFATAEMSYTTGTTFGGLRRVAGKRVAVAAAITVTSEHPSWRATIRIRSPRPLVSIDQPPDLLEVWNLSLTKLITAPAVYEVIDSLRGSCFREIPQHTVYLPAARSGILQSYKTLAGSIIRQSSRALVEEQRNPPMTRIVADFLGGLLELDQNSVGHFAAEADRLEREILHGSISLQGEPVPEVVYRTSAGDYPVGRTSSMVSELAPVVLYLRHELRADDLLVIEEPEAHLHPASQVAFARCLVRLVNQGLRVGLTTHSEFFLQQLNNAIMAGALADDQAAGLGVFENRLDAGKVAAYFFKPTASGTVVERLPIDPKQGIPEASFEGVTEQLYNEAVLLDRRIGDQG